LQGGKYYLIPNPYASVINFDQMYANAGSSNIENSYWFWDPKLSGTGGYVTFSNGVFTPSTGGLSANPSSGYIQSGQSFFVKATQAGTGVLLIEENDKVAEGGYLAMGRPEPTTAHRELIRVNLYNTASSSTLLDGVTSVYSQPYSSDVLISEDASKLDNGGENIAIKRSSKRLAIEARPLIDVNDTVFLDIYNMKQANYRFEVSSVNFDPAANLTATLVDRMTGTYTPLTLNAVNNFNFNVTQSATSYNDRFMIVFKQAGALPVTFESINATESGNDHIITWKTGVEAQMDHYEVEHHTGNGTFETIGKVAAKNVDGSTYKYVHLGPSGNLHYYRIKGVEQTGRVKYSTIAVLRKGRVEANVQIYPNPITDHKVNVKFTSMDADMYEVVLINLQGKKVMETKIRHEGGSAVKQIEVPLSLASGIYIMQVGGKEGVLLRERVQIDN
jgi:hypothetical protein